MPAKEKPLERQVADFVRFHLHDRGAFAPFTGTDFDAWRAFIHLVRLWGRTRERSVVLALQHVVNSAQWWNADVMAVFKKSIPCLLDWGDEISLWREVAKGLDGDRRPDPCPDGPRICAHIHSKPMKNKPGWYKCKDPTCRDEWRLEPPNQHPEPA